MKSTPLAAVLLSISLAGGAMSYTHAQDTTPQTNEQQRKDAEAQTRQDRKASKAQAEADKKANKALKSDKVKDAARAQDKADAEASKTPNR